MYESQGRPVFSNSKGDKGFTVMYIRAIDHKEKKVAMLEKRNFKLTRTTDARVLECTVNQRSRANCSAEERPPRFPIPGLGIVDLRRNGGTRGRFVTTSVGCTELRC